jgi:hypothetical protein
MNNKIWLDLTEQYTSGGVVAYIASYQNVVGSILESFVASSDPRMGQNTTFLLSKLRIS